MLKAFPFFSFYLKKIELNIIRMIQHRILTALIFNVTAHSSPKHPHQNKHETFNFGK